MTASPLRGAIKKKNILKNELVASRTLLWADILIFKKMIFRPPHLTYPLKNETLIYFLGFRIKKSENSWLPPPFFEAVKKNLILLRTCFF